jgi:hypothetical protein
VDLRRAGTGRSDEVFVGSTRRGDPPAGKRIAIGDPKVRTTILTPPAFVSAQDAGRERSLGCSAPRLVHVRSAAGVGLRSYGRKRDENPDGRISQPVLEMGSEAAARTLGVEVAPLEIRRVEDFSPAFQAIKAKADALYVCTRFVYWNTPWPDASGVAFTHKLARFGTVMQDRAVRRKAGRAS